MDKFTDRFFSEFTILLSQRTGIDLGTLNSVNIEGIFAKKIADSHTKGLEEYYLKIIQEPKLFNDLIENIVIPETSFFRHSASFAFLRQYCLEQSFAKSSFRILSVPCSTGEEPYSIAITLLEAGIPPGKIAIDALDISEEAIAKAIEGKYKKYAFRANDDLQEQYHLKKYFNQQADLYCIKPEVQSLVNFKQGNLVSNDFLSLYSEYDIIFCRNVLIYFSDFARRQVLQKLYQLLDEQGLLFIGYAETNFINIDHFRALSIPQAFVYQKKRKQTSFKAEVSDGNSFKSNTVKNNVFNTNTTSRTADLPPLKQRWGNNDVHYKKLTSSLKIIKGNLPNTSKKGMKSNETPQRQLSIPAPIPAKYDGKSSTESKVLEQEKKIDGLLNIRQLANQGELIPALDACQKYLQKYPTDAGGYLLLGEIYQARNLDLDAYTAFKKALYLDPQCTDSLMHLIFLSEQQCNFEQADRYRQRLLSKASDLNLDAE